MSLFKFSFFALFSFSSLAQSLDSTLLECLNINFDVTVEHPGSFFGLMKNRLQVVKNECEIRFISKRYLSEEWLVDVCRTPVHIKKQDGGVKVYKKTQACHKTKGGDFCEQYQKIYVTLQDDGLIFAKGEKEDTTSPHGQLYCVYRLTEKYLAEDLVLSRRAPITTPEGEAAVPPSETAPVSF